MTALNTNNDNKLCSVDASPLSSTTTLSSTTKTRNALKTLQKQNIAKIRNYDTKIREQNRKKILCRKKAENRNYQIQSAYKRNSRNMKILRAVPIVVKNKPNKQNTQQKFKKQNLMKLTKRNLDRLEKENTPINLKKYEYGNEQVLLFMKKQKNYRAKRQKEIQKKRHSEIQRRKNYISSLNKNQRDRAKKISQKKKTNKAKKSVNPKLSQKPIQLISNADEEISININNDPSSNENISKCVDEIDEIDEDNEMYIEINNGMKEIYENRLFEQNNDGIKTMAVQPELLIDSETKPDTDLLLRIYDCIQRNQAHRSEEIENVQIDMNIQQNVDNDICDGFMSNINDNEFEIEMKNRLNILKNEGCKLQERLTHIDNKMCNMDENIIDDMDTNLNRFEMKMEHRLNSLQNQSCNLQQRLENISETLNFSNGKRIEDGNKIEDDKSNLDFNDIGQCENILNIYSNKQVENIQQNILKHENEKMECNNNNAVSAYDKLLLELEIVYNMELAALKLEKLEQLHNENIVKAHEMHKNETNYNEDMQDIQIILKEETTHKLHQWAQSDELNDYLAKETMKQNLKCDKEEININEIQKQEHKNEQIENMNEIIQTVNQNENIIIEENKQEDENQKEECIHSNEKIETNIQKNETEAMEENKLTKNEINENNDIEEDIEQESVEDTESYTSVDEAIQNAIDICDCNETDKDTNGDEEYSEITAIIEENEQENNVEKVEENEMIEKNNNIGKDIEHIESEISMQDNIQNVIDYMYDDKQGQEVEKNNEIEEYSEITEIIEENEQKNEEYTESSAIIEENYQIKEDIDEIGENKNNEKHTDKNEIIEEKNNEMIDVNIDEEIVEDIESEISTDDSILNDEYVENINKDINENENNNIENDLVNKSELIAADLISNMFTKIFEDAKHLVQFRQDRRTIIEGQRKIEKSLNESMGIFDSNKVMLKNDNVYVESYIENVFEYCNELDWTLKSVESTQIDFSVFIYVEEMFNVSKHQKAFNNLIFDTLNEVLMELKLKYIQNKIEPSEKRIIKMVQDKINKVTICDDEKLKKYFTNKDNVDDRIRKISYEWIKEFEHSYEWVTTFDTFKNSMKFQIADMIFQQIIEDIVHELNTIEQHRQIY